MRERQNNTRYFGVQVSEEERRRINYATHVRRQTRNRMMRDLIATLPEPPANWDGDSYKETG